MFLSCMLLALHHDALVLLCKIKVMTFTPTLRGHWEFFTNTCFSSLNVIGLLVCGRHVPAIHFLCVEAALDEWRWEQRTFTQIFSVEVSKCSQHQNQKNLCDVLGASLTFGSCYHPLLFHKCPRRWVPTWSSTKSPFQKLCSEIIVDVSYHSSRQKLPAFSRDNLSNSALCCVEERNEHELGESRALPLWLLSVSAYNKFAQIFRKIKV